GRHDVQAGRQDRLGAGAGHARRGAGGAGRPAGAYGRRPHRRARLMLLSVRFAARELRSGVAGFRIFLACLALGVAAIAAAGSTADAFRQGLASQAREILGGDLRVAVEERRFTVPERKAFEKLGKVAYAIGVRAMAQAPSGERRMVELRGVSPEYPLHGQVKLSGAADLASVFEKRRGAWGAAVEEALLERLGLQPDDAFVIGRTAF